MTDKPAVSACASSPSTRSRRLPVACRRMPPCALRISVPASEPITTSGVGAATTSDSFFPTRWGSRSIAATISRSCFWRAQRAMPRPMAPRPISATLIAKPRLLPGLEICKFPGVKSLIARQSRAKQAKAGPRALLDLLGISLGVLRRRAARMANFRRNPVFAAFRQPRRQPTIPEGIDKELKFSNCRSTGLHVRTATGLALAPRAELLEQGRDVGVHPVARSDELQPQLALAIH